MDAAARILDEVIAGASAEQCLIAWARRSRYAGSKDRAAVRDLVFTALRRRRSLAWIAGEETGRALMLGHLVGSGEDPARVFTGDGYAPDPPTSKEMDRIHPVSAAPADIRVDCPEWLWPLATQALGDKTSAVFELLQERAPVFLRVNTSRVTVEEAVESLAGDGIDTCPGPLSATALLVEGHPRRLQTSSAYRDGLVELQDAASQAAVDLIMPWCIGADVLDYCAGGGGKAVHMASAGAGSITAYDVNLQRMSDIPKRAARAGIDVRVVDTPQGQFDLVLTDVPCSGSGAWRRQPEAKWRLSPERLSDLVSTQSDILRKAASHVRPGGKLAYVTCSFLDPENGDQISRFLDQNSDWRQLAQRQFNPLEGGDGLFVAVLEKP